MNLQKIIMSKYLAALAMLEQVNVNARRQGEMLRAIRKIFGKSINIDLDWAGSIPAQSKKKI